MNNGNQGGLQVTDGWACLEMGDTVLVRCVSKPADKNYFCGESDRFPGMQIICEYAGRFRKDSPDVLAGVSYLCKIKKKDGSGGKRSRFVVVPFAVAPEGGKRTGKANALNGDSFDNTVPPAKKKVTGAPGGDNG
ncbi:MAG: hypothetical protein IKO41_07820 [Lachnospiraceae bacterium]|nr:hypothetical protein [Lachnospiraceae bacterium]